jgi:hypothetical protein
LKMQINRNVYPGSKISKLPSYLHYSALILRNTRDLILRSKLRNRFTHEFDGIGTNHNMHFLDDSHFQKCHQRAVSAAGYDYGIPLRLHQAMWCADLANQMAEDAIFVELGTGRGFVMTAICQSLADRTTKFRTRGIFLFDTFNPYRLNSEGNADEALGINPHYAESYEKVVKNFSEWDNVTIISGKLPTTLESIKSRKIAFLHIDLNAPDVEIESINHLWDSILPGAPILIDDFAYIGYQKTLEKFEIFAKERGFSILTSASGQGIAIKPFT